MAKKPRTKTQAKKGRGRGRRDSRSLVWLDAAPLIAEEEACCRSLGTNLALALEELDHHLLANTPAYSRWLLARFGDSLAGLEELERRAEELQLVALAVESLAAATGRSKRNAFAQISRTRRGSAYLEEIRARQGAPAQPCAQARYLAEAQEPAAGGEKETLELDPWAPGSEGTGAAPETTGRSCQQLFRDIARRLHPDRNASFNRRHSDIWHEAKAAFKAGDADSLEMLWVLATDGRSRFPGRTRSLSLWREARKNLEKRLSAVYERLQRARRRRAWKFRETLASPPLLDSLAESLHREIAQETERALARVRAGERQVARWKIPIPAKPRLAAKPPEKSPQLNLFP